VGETQRLLGVWIQEHRRNLREGLTEKSKLVKHTKNVTRQAGKRQKFCKLKPTADRESAHMACLENLISQLSLELSTIWILLINKEVEKNHRKN
jgi:hypothetical protein